MLDSLAGVGTVIVVHHTGNATRFLKTRTYMQLCVHQSHHTLCNDMTADQYFVRMCRTDCGLGHVTDDELKLKLKERAGPEKENEVDAMKFGAITE